MAADNTRRISSVLFRQSGGQRGAEFRESSGFLTPEELHYWSENFRLPAAEAKLVPVLKPREEFWKLDCGQMCEKVSLISLLVVAMLHA